MQIRLRDDAPLNRNGIVVRPAIPFVDSVMHSEIKNDHNAVEAPAVAPPSPPQSHPQLQKSELLQFIQEKNIRFLVDEKQRSEDIIAFYNDHQNLLVFQTKNPIGWGEYTVAAKNSSLDSMMDQVNSIMLRLKVTGDKKLAEITVEEENAVSVIRKQLQREETITSQQFAIRLNGAAADAAPQLCTCECRLNRKGDSYFVHLYEIVQNSQEGQSQHSELNDHYILRDVVALGKLSKNHRQHLIKNFALLTSSNVIAVEKESAGNDAAATSSLAFEDPSAFTEQLTFMK